MSLNVTPCDLAADSFACVEFADQYISAHPDYAYWDDLPGDDEIVIETKEKLLVAASRMISRAPLSAKPLADAQGWPDGQALAVPVKGHRLVYGVADALEGNMLRDASLENGSRKRYIGGGIRTDDGIFIGVDDFDPATGTCILLETPPKEFGAGSPYILVEAQPIAVKHAACEQALFLASAPSLSILNEIELGLRSASAEGAGGGQVTLRPARNTGELCFAARRLLASCGLLRDAGSIPAGRA